MRARGDRTRLADVDARRRARRRGAVQRVPAGGPLHAHVGSGAPLPGPRAAPGDRLPPSTAWRTRPFVSGRFRALLPAFPARGRVLQARWVLARRLEQPLRGHRRARAAHGAPRRLRPLDAPLRARGAGTRTRRACPGGTLGRALFRGDGALPSPMGGRASARPHVLIANSTYTRERIRRYYQRDAEVIEPPIETHRFERAAPLELSADDRGRTSSCRRSCPTSASISRCARSRGDRERLVVVGEGPERARLERLAGPNVTLLARRRGGRARGALRPLPRPASHRASTTSAWSWSRRSRRASPSSRAPKGARSTSCATARPASSSARRRWRPSAKRSTASQRRRRRSIPRCFAAFAKRFDRAHFERRFARRSTTRAPGVAATGAAPARATTAMPTRSQVGSRATAAAMATPVPTGTAVPTSVRNGNSNGHSAANGAAHGGLPRARGRAIRPLGEPGRPERAPRRRWERAISSRTGRLSKRVVDVALAASGLVARGPLDARPRRSSSRSTRPGPALFYQRRARARPAPFTMVKLRTMDGGATGDPGGPRAAAVGARRAAAALERARRAT